MSNSLATPLFRVVLLCIALHSAAFAAAQLNGTVQQVSFQGPFTNVPINFSIYLPPGYGTDLSTNYPVVYHLHGLGGTHV
ncbi:MAG: hypothetical protein WEC15_00660, partial [Flavobacteriales bacterium]